MLSESTKLPRKEDIHQLGVIINSLVNDLDENVILKRILFTQIYFIDKNTEEKIHKKHESKSYDILEDGFSKMLQFYKETLMNLNSAYAHERAKIDYFEVKKKKNTKINEKFHKLNSDIAELEKRRMLLKFISEWDIHADYTNENLVHKIADEEEEEVELTSFTTAKTML